MSSLFSEIILINNDEAYDEFINLETKINYIKISLNEDLKVNQNFTEKEIDDYLKKIKRNMKEN